MTHSHENKNTDPRAAAVERALAVRRIAQETFNNFARQAFAEGMDEQAVAAAAKEAFANGTLPRIVEPDTSRPSRMPRPKPYGDAQELTVFAAPGRIPDSYLKDLKFEALRRHIADGRDHVELGITAVHRIQSLPNDAIQLVYSPNSVKPNRFTGATFTGDIEYVNQTNQLMEAEVARAAEQAEQMRIAGLGHTAAEPMIQPPADS